MTRVGRWAGRSPIRWVVVAGVAVYAIALGSGLLANAKPARAYPIGSVDEWALDTGFERTARQASSWDLHSTANHDLVRAEPSAGEPTELVRSTPFAAPDSIAVFYLLRSDQHPHLNLVDVDEFSGISLVCTASSETIAFPTAETNDRLAESVLTVPAGFCAGPVVLEAHAKYPVLLDVSTPHRVDSGVVESRGLPAQLVRHLALFTVLAAIGLAGALALARMSPRLADEGSVLATAMLAIGLVSYSAFFVYWMSPRAGRMMSALVVGGAIGFILNEIRGNRHRSGVVLRNFAPGVLVWFLVSAFFVTLLYSLDTGAGPWQANSRYFPAVWSSDNNLPMTISEALYRGDDLRGILGDDWRVSDRGPLQAGTGALLRPLALITEPAGISGQRLASLHHITGILLNTLWAVAIVRLGIAMRWGRRLTQGAVVLVALSPVGVFNSSYVWPKMAAAAFAIVAMSGVISFDDGSDPSRQRTSTDWVLGAALAALALLCHASIVFFLFAAGLWIIVRGPRPAWRQLLAASGTAVIIMVPWMSWQRLVDPPGNALIKYTLAGTFGMDEPEKSVLDTMIDSYREIGFDGWWQLRKNGVRDVTIEFWTAPNYDGDGPDKTRMTQLIGVAPALGPVAVAVVAVTLIGGTGRDQAFRTAKRLVLLGLIAIATNVLVFWGPQILAFVPLATIVALTLGAVLAIRHVNRWVASGIAAASVASCFAVWIADPLVGSQHVNVAAATLASVAALIGTVHLIRTVSSSSPSATQESGDPIVTMIP